MKVSFNFKNEDCLSIIDAKQIELYTFTCVIIDKQNHLQFFSKEDLHNLIIKE